MTAGQGTPIAAPPATALDVGLGHVLTEVKDRPTQPRPPIVEFRNVTKTYNAGLPNAFTAIRDINFVVDDAPGKGEFVAVLGPSGCGKSTILRLIAGLEPQHPPTTGQVLVQGAPVVRPGPDRGMVFQDYTSFDNRTVLDNITFGLECRGMPRRERDALGREWIGKVGLNEKEDASKYPHELSGGMRQRVAIARTLILRPRIILMDEPFGALDLLVRLWREVEATVFFITHSVEEAVYLGDRVYLMGNSPGTIVEEMVVDPPDRPAEDMQRDPRFLQTVYYVRDKITQFELKKRSS
jgi:NitT/TauT family transport system ATP-binding protein